MNIEELKNRIDCADLAEKLGLSQPKPKGNWTSPKHKDKSPSLSIFQGGKRWKDWSTDEGGTCIDLVMYVEGCEVADALKRLHEIYGFPMDQAQRPEEQRRPRTRAEFIAEKCLLSPDKAIPYLTEQRNISEETVRRAIKAGAIGFNEWTAGDRAPKPDQQPLAAGDAGWGGPAVAFIVRSMQAPEILAVEMRYLDPQLNGGIKTQTQGEKANAPFFIDRRQVERAKTIYLVESPINALSIEDCRLPYSAAVAIRGVATVDSMDWQFLMGKRVVLAMDNDEPDDKGKRAGLQAAWKIYDQLAALGVACHFVEQLDWKKSNWNDVNDILKDGGTEELSRILKLFCPWIIPGQNGKTGEGVDSRGRSRIHLPSQDFSVYWKYRAKEDFVSYVKEAKEQDGVEHLVFEDLCGFRIASFSRVTIPSATATLTGEKDAQPRTLFSVSVQSPRHGQQLQRRVFEDEKIHNPEQWQKFGPVWNRGAFLRMVNILERSAEHDKRKAINFVGVAWKDGKPVVNEGPDCYFQEPEKQCPYHNLVFPSGSQRDAQEVIGQYHKTFKHNAALMLLAWALGGHLKAFTGFWPHCTVQARKGSGKTTLIKRLERTIGMTMFSGQSLMTEFRMLTSLSSTSHPVGWEELSARRQDVIDKAQSLLQEAYQHGMTRRGSEMTEYVICAPVLLAGEDVPVNSLLGKLVAVDLAEKGPIMPEEMPRFPVRQWLDYLAKMGKDDVRRYYADALHYCQENCRSTDQDAGAKRMVHNYAAVLATWYIMADFAELDSDLYGFQGDLVRRMNTSIKETTADREPWVWILEKLTSEISSKRFRHPYCIDSINGTNVLLVRTSHIIHHLSGESSLREFWNGLTIKSDRVLKRQLKDAGVVAVDSSGHYIEDQERVIGDMRVGHLCALDLDALEKFGIFVPVETAPGRGAGGETLPRDMWTRERD